MPGLYTYGTTVLVRIRFYDINSQPTDPPGVSLEVRRPDGVKFFHLLTDPATPIARIAEGIYTAIILVNCAGRWAYAWKATSPTDEGSRPGEESYFDVKPTSFGECVA
jgi:hypothetical protein